MRLVSPGAKVLGAAINYVRESERFLKKNSEATIWGIEQAFLSLSEKVKGSERRAYLKRATLLRMLLNELYQQDMKKKGHAAGRSNKQLDIANARAMLERIWRDESLEATNEFDALEMFAFDWGYQGRPLPEWARVLGKAIGVDVDGEYKKGLEESPR